MGPAFDDVDDITAASDYRDRDRLQATVAVLAWKPWTCRFESLTAVMGTGPFQIVDPDSANELRANDSYYLGPPSNRSRSSSRTYPSVRAAWADLLRDQIDMLYEVSADALDSLTGATDCLRVHVCPALSVRHRVQSTIADVSLSRVSAGR